MKFLVTTIHLLAFSTLMHGNVLRVGPGQAFGTIQSAIDAAMPGDTVEVAAGLYPESVVIDTGPITLQGAQAAVDARGRVHGAPDPALESIVAPAVGPALTVAAADGPVTIAGFVWMSAANAGSGVVSVTAAADGLVCRNNHVQVAAGSAGSALWFGAGATDATLESNVFFAAADSTAAVSLSNNHVFGGLRFVANEVLRDGASVHAGLAVNGIRNVSPSGTRPPVIIDNLFRGHATGLDAGARSLQGVEISGNRFENNAEGMAGGPKDCFLHHNQWSNNTIRGLRLTAFDRAGDPGSGAQGNRIEDNAFSGNGTSVSAAGYGDVCCDDQAAGTLDTNALRRNRIGSTVAISQNDSGAILDAAWNYWGAADGPSGAGPGTGGVIQGAGAVVYQPWYADTALKSMVFGNVPLEGTVTLSSGQSITGASLTLAPAALLEVGEGASVKVDELIMDGGSTVRVNRGSAQFGWIGMSPDAVLDVIDGQLSLDPSGSGGFHTIDGTFTFFNCLGSIAINGNTTFSGSTLGIASDIHVAPGVTVLVLGSLVLDGCRLDSTGNFNIQVNYGARFSMVRCDVTRAFVSLVGSDVTLRDNLFTSSVVTVFSTVNGARIYHNIFTGTLGALTILPGAVVTTTVEGWGNVTGASAVRNELSIRFQAPFNPTRTLDSAGNLFVQPDDPVIVGLDIAKLNVKAQAVEVMLGYSSNHLAFASVTGSSDWNNSLYQAYDASGMIGKLDSAVGLGFAWPDPDGTTAAGQVASIRMAANSPEGRSRVFFRAKDSFDHPLIDTRITGSSGGIPFFKSAPFTKDTAIVTVDGTPPVFAAGATGVQTQGGVPVDVLSDGVYTRVGSVTVTFDVTDALAGIDTTDAADVRAELVGTGTTVTGTLVSRGEVTSNGVSYFRHVYSFAITTAVPDGLYDVNATAMDRSGNAGVLTVGTLEVSKYRILATVQPQALVGSDVTRNVTFVATDSSGAAMEWRTVPVLFQGGVGMVMLEQIPPGTVNLSAKMAWNLRVRLPVTFDDQNVAAVSFTGSSLLPGGDFTGDNVVNLGDYNLMRSVFPGYASVPDITGDGYVNLADYNILRANWLTGGGPL